jgi:predicted metallopeptidase
MTTLNLTGALDRLVVDIVAKTDELSHICPSKLMICLSATRSGGIHGVYAKIHPLRFAGGALTRQVRRGRKTYTCRHEPLDYKGEEMLYVIYFLFPRFFDLPFREKLITIFHELYHISPEFDGDIRRFPGRNYAHGSSTRKFNEYMGTLADRYLEQMSEQELVDFLKVDVSLLRTRHRALVGRKLKAPRIRIAAN